MQNKILNMSLNNFNDASVKAFGLAKISSEALNYNLSCYNSLGKDKVEGKLFWFDQTIYKRSILLCCHF